MAVGAAHHAFLREQFVLKRGRRFVHERDNLFGMHRQPAFVRQFDATRDRIRRTTHDTRQRRAVRVKRRATDARLHKLY